MSNYRRDFTKGGIYFFTLVLQDRKKDYLIKYIDEFRLAYKETQEKLPFDTIAITILPDHLHLIMQLPENDDNYSDRIRLLKTKFSQKLPLNCRTQNSSQLNKNEAGIWQRRFWEHLVRNETELGNYIDYIYYNPVKHGYVNRVSDWKYSSFHRDVKNGIIQANWGEDTLPSIMDFGYLD